MKKFIAILLILLNIEVSYASLDTEKSEFKKFIITAYYSPLPDQSIYLKWNYEDEVTLNWAGIRWASGKWVYSGMLAWPKTYSFWTKIFLSWIWVGTVDDRWWAIVGSGSRGYDGDRIDIWMWYGEEWLKRALTWWKRTVYWKIVNENEVQNKSPIDIEKFKIWKVSLSKVTSIYNVVPENIWKNSSIEDLKKAQEIFAKLWFYNWDIDWKYNKLLIDAIADFQVNNDLLSSSFDKSAGFYWIKTKAKLKEKYLSFLNAQKIAKAEEVKKQKEFDLKKEEAKKIVDNFWIPKVGEIWDHIRNLQKTMKALWYFEEKDTAIFWLKTKNSIINYQLKNWIIKSKNDEDAWVIWEKTQKSLQNDLVKYLISNKNKTS